MLQEEASKIKENLKGSLLDSFTVSNGWLEKWKATYVIRETRDGIPELVRGYKLEDIWNMDELELFFKIPFLKS